MEDNSNITSNRRAALKALAAATGAAGLAALPSQWSKPVLRVGAVPAHAQTSRLACIDYALFVNNFVLETGAGEYTFYTPSAEEIGAGYIAWLCGSGCITFLAQNPGLGPGNFSFDVAIFNQPSFPVSLAPGEVFWLVINRDTLQQNSTIVPPITNIPNSFWTDIGCTRPPS